MTSNPATGVDLDALVEQMLKKGTEHVSRPPRLPEYDFEQIREIVKDVLLATEASTYQIYLLSLADGRRRRWGFHGWITSKTANTNAPYIPISRRNDPLNHSYSP